MLYHRIISPQRQNRPFADILVKKQVLVNKIALIRISRPDPAIPFHPVQEKNAAGQPERGIRNLPNPVYQPVTTGKAASFREIHIFIQRFHRNQRSVFPLRYKKITESPELGMIALPGLPAPERESSTVRLSFRPAGTARRYTVLFPRDFQYLLQITQLRIQRLRPGFPVAQRHLIRPLLPVYFYQRIRRQLPAEIIQHSPVHPFCGDRPA